MPVPDPVHFGPAADNSGLTYGQVRAMSEGEQFQALQRRFDRFFLSQVGELAKLNGGKRVVYRPTHAALPPGAFVKKKKGF